MLDLRIQEWEVRGFSWSHGYGDDGEAMTSVLLKYASGDAVELCLRAADLQEFDTWLGESYARCQQAFESVAVATLGTAGEPEQFVVTQIPPTGEQVDLQLPVVLGTRFDETPDGSAVVVEFDLGRRLDPAYAAFPIGMMPLFRDATSKVRAKFR